MASLLSLFDPSSSFLSLPLNWSVMVAPMFLITERMFVIPSYSGIILMEFCSLLQQWFKSEKGREELYMVSLCIFFLLSNVSGLVPFSFSSSSHMVFNLNLTLTLWMAGLVWGFFFSFSKSLAHLTPSGCPLGLAPFMVSIELISLLIRPLTLSLRLMSNVLAGHLIISLMSWGISSLSSVPALVLFGIQVGFVLFEMGVSVIQAYVLSMLMSMYWQESVS
nr:ATP synthase subunit 6 [Austromenopon atrofulvum]